MGIRSFLWKTYPSLPLPLQNVLISGQGWLFRRQRFSEGFRRGLLEAIERATWTSDHLTAWQVDEARRFLTHAGESSTYWGRRFTEAGFDPSSFAAPEHIRRVPILEKDDLRHRAPEIASRTASARPLIASHTSGTTGTPISVAFTRPDFQTRMAYLHRMLALFGIEPLARSVRFSGRVLFPDAARNGIFWRLNRPMNQMLMSSHDLHPRNMQAYVDQLERYRPVLIDGYPSSIFVIARFINTHGQSGRISPRAVMTTAETLEDYQREDISKAFGGCPVINQYASSEGAPLITQDPDGAMVVNTDSGIFEFVRPGTDEPAAPGELAEMLLTSFTTHAYPLIRYRIGDTVLLPATARHSAVWDMPVVERVFGRQEDILFTPERGYIGSLNKVFVAAPQSIREAQIVQLEPRRFLVKVVPEAPATFNPRDMDGPRKELLDRVGNVKVDVEIVGSLPRGANGKLRAVVGMSAERRIADQS